MHSKILVVRFGSLGDVILASAAVINLRIAHPSAHIAFLTKSQFRSTVELFTEVNEIVTIGNEPRVFDLFRTAIALDKQDFDIIVDLHGNGRSWYICKTVTAGRKARYPKRRWERHEATRRHHKRLPSQWPHTIDLYNTALESISVSTPAFRPVLSVAKQAAGNSRSNMDAPARFRIIFAPGAAHPTKQYPLERLVQAASTLKDVKEAAIVWIVTAADARRLNEIPASSGGGDEVYVDRPIGELASLMSGADLTIANDSGLMHLSSAVGTPVIGIFGPTHPVLGFAPRGQFDRVLEVDEFCRPCSLHGRKPCYREERHCFSRITPTMIVDEAIHILEDRTDLSPALFVDRDGTIIVNKEFNSDPDQIEFETGSVEGLRLAKSLGYKIVVVSNQSGVARGFFGTADVEKANSRLAEMLLSQGVVVDGIYYSPYYKGGSVPEFSVEHPSRKPGPDMPEKAAAHLGLDLRRSWVIGDKLDDYFLGKVIGARSILVRTGNGDHHSRMLGELALSDSHTIAANLGAAVRLIASLS